MHDAVLEFVRICTENLLVPEPVYEFGSLQVPGQVGYADLRPLFPDKQYVGSDIREGPGVDMNLDIHDIDLPEASIGTALVFNTLEHVERPWVAIEQLHRVLIPNGIVVLSVPFSANIHDFPSDYWRFTPACLKNLLKIFPNSWVSCAGRKRRPHTVVGIGYGKKTVLPQRFHSEIEAWQFRWPDKDHAPRAFFEKQRRKLIKSGKKRLSKLFGQ